MSNSTDTNVALFKRMLVGDEYAAERFVKIYTKEIYSYCYRNLKHHHQNAEDVAQTALIKFWKSMHKIEKPEKFKSYLYTIASNCIVDFLRDPRNRPEPEKNDDDSDRNPWDQNIEQGNSNRNNIDGRVINRQLISIIMIILDTINPDQKDAIILVKFQGLTYKEAAEVLGTVEDTVKTRVNRGMIKVAKELKRRGIQYEV